MIFTLCDLLPYGRHLPGLGPSASLTSLSGPQVLVKELAKFTTKGIEWAEELGLTCLWHGQLAAHHDLDFCGSGGLMTGLCQRSELGLHLCIRILKVMGCVEQAPAMLRQAPIVHLGVDVMDHRLLLKALDEWHEEMPLQAVLVQAVRRSACTI